MIEQIPFNGIVDLDTSNEAFQKGMLKNARNVIFKGANQLRAENLKGTRKITVSLPSGTNVCIGSYYDELRQRVIWFNYNSNGSNGIYSYQTITGAVSAIFLSGGTDILNFTLGAIHSIDILYGDSDFLYFIDSLKRPTKININRALAGEYASSDRSVFDAAKEPPLLPPTSTYQNDGAAIVNNLRKNLFQFRYRWMYNDYETSAWSTMSEVPLPVDFLNTTTEADPTKNSKIAVTINTGKATVAKLQVAARTNLGEGYGNWYMLTTLDKSKLSISNNTTYVYDFRNDTAGEYIDIRESVLGYDFVPRQANTQAILNGNIVAYGGLLEGYNNDFNPLVSITVDDVTEAANADNIVAVYNWWSKYKFGLIYYDDKGRTNGVLTNASFNVTTLGYNEASGVVKKPRLTTYIAHRPPVWAKTYQWVRTKNLSKSKFLYWVTDSTFKDPDFAYISIQSLYTRREENEQTILTYDFTPGDRIKFVYTVGGAILSNKDYEIKELVVNPTVGGVDKEGAFLKIKLPTTSGTFDFGTTGFGNYLVELYTPVAKAGAENVYYEFGEAYDIGNAGLSTRYHKGGTQDQSTNLATSAASVFTEGDVYLKTRKIDVGGLAYYTVHPGSAWTSNMLIGVTKYDDLVGNETYLTGQTDFDEASDVNVYLDDTKWIIKTQGDAYTLRMKGAIKINTPSSTGYRLYLTYANTVPPQTFIDLVPVSAIGVGDHTFTFDKTFTIPANRRVYLMTDNTNGTAPIKYTETKFTIGNTTSYAKKIIDANFSDTFASAVNSNGRPVVVDEALRETYNPTLVRYSLAYQQGTNINGTNRFLPQNFDEYDRARGDIERFKVRGQNLRVFQRRGCGIAGIFETMLTSADGNNSLMKSDAILNKIHYYQEEYGIGNQPTSLASSSGADYFTDPVKGEQVRLAGDGLTSISKIYRTQYYLPPIITKYLKADTTANGAASKIIGVFNFIDDEFVTVFQKRTIDNVNADTIRFNETRNGYCGFVDFDPESVVCSEKALVMFKNGELYVQDSETRNTFFGTAYPSIIDVVINPGGVVVKEYLAVNYHSKTTWESPVITTSDSQTSNLVAGDFRVNNNLYHASFGRDTSSTGGWSEGDFLKGQWMQLRLQNGNTTLAFIFGLHLNIKT